MDYTVPPLSDLPVTEETGKTAKGLHGIAAIAISCLEGAPYPAFNKEA